MCTTIYTLHLTLFVCGTGNKKWTRPKTAGTLPEARNSHSATLVGNKIWYYGGCHGAENYFGDIVIFDTGE